MKLSQDQDIQGQSPSYKMYAEQFAVKSVGSEWRRGVKESMEAV